jgi:hypothetical protein
MRQLAAYDAAAKARRKIVSMNASRATMILVTHVTLSTAPPERSAVYAAQFIVGALT